MPIEGGRGEVKLEHDQGKQLNEKIVIVTWSFNDPAATRPYRVRYCLVESDGVTSASLHSN